MAPVPAEEKLPHIELGLMATSLAPFRQLLPDGIIVKFLSQCGYTWRDRVYTPLIVFWSMIAQCMEDDHSCRASVVRVMEWLRVRKAPGQRRNRKVPGVSVDTGSYCRARARLPLQLFEEMARKVGRDLDRQVRSADKPWGRDVYLVDGTTVSMPDTPQLVAEFGKHHGGVNRSKLPFPFAWIVSVISLATGAVMDISIGGCHTSEHSLFHVIWQGAQWLKGAVVVGDSLYGAYGELAMLSGLGIDLIARPCGNRKKDFRKGKRLGKGDRLVVWKRGKHPPLWLGSFESLPQELTLRLIEVQTLRRGHRPKRIVLVTTLLDSDKYPADQIAALYLRRWEIEVDMRHLKAVLGMDVLRGLSPDIVRKEIWSFIATYNLVRRVMWEGAASHDFPPSGLEFQSSTAVAAYLHGPNRMLTQCKPCEDTVDERA